MRWDPEHYDTRHSYVWQYGAQDLVPLLAARTGERVLDLGCGTGQLTANIASTGACVEGLDQSSEMVAQARAAFPELRFRVADARSFTVEEPVDAVFSNAVLHWVREADAAARAISSALRPGGRLIAEFGGRYNVAEVCRAAALPHPWYFPNIPEYAAVLADAGLEVRQAWHFPRPTQLNDPAHGFRSWIHMFGAHWLAMLPDGAERDQWLSRAEDEARPALFRDGDWYIDYWRLRLVAVKL